VEAPYLLMEALGKEKVLGGYCKIVSRIIAPGHICNEAADPSIGFGEMTPSPNGQVSNRVKSIEDLFKKSGFKVELPDDIRVGMWHKLMLISSISGIGACTRAPLEVVLQIPETRELLKAALYEVVQVAQVQGIGLTEEAAEQLYQYFLHLYKVGTKNTTSSMQRDVLRGLPSEIYWQSGAVVRIGKAVGVPTPVHSFMLATLLPQEKKARKELDYDIALSNL